MWTRSREGSRVATPGPRPPFGWARTPTELQAQLPGWQLGPYNGDCTPLPWVPQPEAQAPPPRLAGVGQTGADGGLPTAPNQPPCRALPISGPLPHTLVHPRGPRVRPACVSAEALCSWGCLWGSGSAVTQLLWLEVYSPLPQACPQPRPLPPVRDPDPAVRQPVCNSSLQAGLKNNGGGAGPVAPSVPGTPTVTPKARDEPGVVADQLRPPKHPCPFPEMRVLFCGGMTAVVADTGSPQCARSSRPPEKGQRTGRRRQGRREEGSPRPSCPRSLVPPLGLPHLPSESQGARGPRAWSGCPSVLQPGWPRPAARAGSEGAGGEGAQLGVGDGPAPTAPSRKASPQEETPQRAHCLRGRRNACPIPWLTCLVAPRLPGRAYSSQVTSKPPQSPGPPPRTPCHLGLLEKPILQAAMSPSATDRQHGGSEPRAQ